MDDTNATPLTNPSSTTPAPDDDALQPLAQALQALETTEGINGSDPAIKRRCQRAAVAGRLVGAKKGKDGDWRCTTASLRAFLMAGGGDSDMATTDANVTPAAAPGAGLTPPAARRQGANGAVAAALMPQSPAERAVLVALNNGDDPITVSEATGVALASVLKVQALWYTGRGSRLLEARVAKLEVQVQALRDALNPVEAATLLGIPEVEKWFEAIWQRLDAISGGR